MPVRQAVLVLISCCLPALALPAAGAAVVVEVDARETAGANNRFWASFLFHPTEYLSTPWGKEHIALLRESGAALNYVRIYNQPEDAAYLRDDGSIGTLGATLTGVPT